MLVNGLLEWEGGSVGCNAVHHIGWESSIGRCFAVDSVGWIGHNGVS